MLHNKQKVVTGMSIMIIVAILTFGSSSYSLVSAISSQSSVDHHKASVKKQESRSDANADDRSSKDKGNAERNDKVGASSGSSQGHSSDASSSTSNSDTEGSDNSNNVGDAEKNNNNNNQATDDGSNTGIGENVPSITPAIPAPHRSCDQGSNCTDQQDPSNTDHPTAATPTKQGSTPFVLSLPFP
jgi:hypothetical protein